MSRLGKMVPAAPLLLQRRWAWNVKRTPEGGRKYFICILSFKVLSLYEVIYYFSYSNHQIRREIYFLICVFHIERASNTHLFYECSNVSSVRTEKMFKKMWMKIWGCGWSYLIISGKYPSKQITLFYLFYHKLGVYS